MKIQYYIFLFLLLSTFSCETNIRPDTYFDCYLDVEFNEEIEWVVLSFEYARMHAEDQGSSYITTLKLNPVDHLFEFGPDRAPLYLGDSEWRSTQIIGFDFFIEATVKYKNSGQLSYERCDGGLILNNFDYLLQDNDKKEILFKVLLDESIEDECINAVVDVSIL